MTVSGVRSSWLALAMNCRWLVNARSSRSSIVSNVSASSRSSSRGPCRAMRWDRVCSLAARAAAVSRCAGLDTAGIHRGALLHYAGTTTLRRLEALLESLLCPPRDTGFRLAVQGVRDQQVGDQYQGGPAQREQRRVEQCEPRPGAEMPSHSR